MSGGKDMRRGLPGQGNRPWVAVWLVLMERAMDGRGIAPGTKTLWLESLGAFVLEFRRHPGRLTSWEVRDFLFRHGELGGSDNSRSLSNSIEAVAFFYEHVVPRPNLAAAARRPFDVRPDREAAGDEPLLDLLRERLLVNGAQDWSAA